MKKTLYTLVFTVMAGISFGQQLPVFSQYYYNPFIYNPGFTGMEERAHAYAIHRSQWKDMPGAPTTYALTVDGPVWEKKVGLGLSLYSDQIDMWQRSGIMTSYSYRFKLAEDQWLVPGISVGITDNRIDLSRSIVKDAQDPFLYDQNRRKVSFDANFGLAYIWKDLRVGLSVMQLAGNKIAYLNSDQSGVFQKLQQHYIFSAMYKVTISESAKVAALPSAMVRYTSGAPVQFDINAIFEWNEMVRAGISYRHQASVGFMAGIQVNKNLTAGYVYDMSISAVKQYAKGGHEIMLGFAFGGGNKSVDDSKMRELTSKIEQAQLRNDSLANELRKRDIIHDQEINKLKAKTDSLAKATKNTGDTGNNSNNNNSNNNNSNNNNTANNDLPKGLIRAEKVADYTDENGNGITPGYYVIVESFRNITNAKNNKDFYEKQKQIKVMTIYNKKRKFYYNSVLYTTDEESAVDLVTEIKKEKPDSWVFKLMDEE